MNQQMAKLSLFESMPQHVVTWYKKHEIHPSRYTKCIPLPKVFAKLEAKGFSGPFLPVYMFMDAGSWGFCSYYIVKCSQNFYHVIFSANSSCTSNQLVDEIDTLTSLNDIRVSKDMKQEIIGRSEEYEVNFFKNHYSEHEDRKNTPRNIMT